MEKHTLHSFFEDGALFSCSSLRRPVNYDRIKPKQNGKEGCRKLKRLVITILFVIATMLAAAGIFSNFDIDKPPEQFPVIGQTSERTN